MLESMLIKKRTGVRWFHVDPSLQTDLSAVYEQVSGRPLVSYGNPRIVDGGPPGYSRCIEFVPGDGRDYYTFPYSGLNVPNIGVGDFDISTWYYPVTNGAQVPFGDWVQSTDKSNWMLWCNNGTVTFWFSPYNQGVPMLSSPAVIPLNQWVHLRVTRVKNVFTMYINGVAVASLTSSATRANQVGNMVTLGIYQNAQGGFPDSLSQSFTGKVTDLRITCG